MSKKKYIFFLGLFLLILISMTTVNTKAHNPSSMSLSYDSNTEVLSVTITHTVSNPSSHYIESVVIRVNGSTVLNQPYTNQPSTNSFTYDYNITAGDGATIQVTASCSISGSITGSTTIGDDSNGQNTDSDILGNPIIFGYTGIFLIIGISVMISLLIFYKIISRKEKMIWR